MLQLFSVFWYVVSSLWGHLKKLELKLELKNCCIGSAFPIRANVQMYIYIYKIKLKELEPLLKTPVEQVNADVA